MKKRGRLIAVFVGAIVIALIAWAFVPKPVKVEKGRVQRGSLRVTGDEEAETRMHDRFEIAAPVTGHLQRIELHAADPVERAKSWRRSSLYLSIPVSARNSWLGSSLPRQASVRRKLPWNAHALNTSRPGGIGNALQGWQPRA
jgi:hypothetical protein